MLADRYLTEQQIGIGGMGTVFSAEDQRLSRNVAIKLLKEELSADPKFVERFRREARAAAALAHPNIANVFDYGEDDGRYFIVMELVEGRDLARLMREDGPLDSQRALLFTEQIARALGHAHSAGLIHRDVKPANVIVTEDDRVKVTDFGIARAIGDSTLTATGTIMGTAQYISPEQASGESLGPPSDVYALGIVLYEMVTGTVPFTGDSPVSLALRHLREEVPKPSELDPALPREIDELVATATAKQPDDRYRDGNAFADALTGESAPQTAPLPVAETLAWPFEQPPRYDPRRLGKIVLLTFGILFLIALTALGIRLASRETPRERAATNGGRPTNTERTPVVETFALPDYRGQQADQAIADLGALGLAPIEEPGECGQDKGVVCEQSPEPGSAVAAGDSVTLLISTSQSDEESDEDDDSGVGSKDKVPPGQEKKEKDED